MDIRIQKSKKAIMDALTHLMAKKDFDKITINEIAKQANVNRGTVYLHYVDKFDLLNHCIETHLNQLFEICMQKEDIGHFSSKTAMLRIFEYLEQHVSFYSNMLTNKGIPTFRNRLLTLVQKMIEEQIDRKGISKNVNKDILVQYVTSATVGVIEWWITQEMPYPATEMVEQLWSLFEQVQLVHQL